jgi:hypothetical protein
MHPTVKTAQKILVDAHVHIHKCFDLERFFDAALLNFQSFSASPGSDFVLLLTESSKDNYFSVLSQIAHGDRPLAVSLGRWTMHTTQEAGSLYAAQNQTAGLFMIAGKQIVTSEKLEVLALMTTQSFEDGYPLREVLKFINESGGIAVIPWGFGKWMGKRQKVLEQLFLTNKPPRVFLGDNSGRPSFWSTPPLFQLPQNLVTKVLPGSDPLPFPSEVARPGSFGFSLNAVLDPLTPAASLKQAILDPALSLTPYGNLEKPHIFVRHQVAMQLLKYFQKK